MIAITIACTDLDRSERFYCDLLGARAEFRDGQGCRWLTMGSMRISLMQNAEQASPARFGVHAMPILWLETPDLALAQRTLEASGVAIVHPSDGQFMVVADPDGLVVEIWGSEIVVGDDAASDEANRSSGVTRVPSE
jgi:catechol 2,3-dioxygenase-like lactoylglutathione lyase family enzyme